MSICKSVCVNTHLNRALKGVCSFQIWKEILERGFKKFSKRFFQNSIYIFHHFLQICFQIFAETIFSFHYSLHLCAALNEGLHGADFSSLDPALNKNFGPGPTQPIFFFRFRPVRLVCNKNLWLS